MTKQRYSLWEIRDFSAGQVEKLNDNILPDNAAHECRNFIASRYGGLSKRKGQERLNKIMLDGNIQGIHPYYERVTNVRRLITMASGLGYLWNGETFVSMEYAGAESELGDLFFPLIGSALFNEKMFNHPDGVFPLDPTALVIFEDAVNFVVAMNGVDRPWKWGGSYITFLTNAPEKGRYPILHKEKLFCVNTDEPSTLRWSESFDPEDWPIINYWDVRKGDGDEITCLQKFVDELLVFKNRSLHTLKGTSLEDFSMQEITSNVGCVGPLASAVHDLKVYFVSEQGIYLTNALNVVNITDMIIPDTWEKVNKEFLHKACVTVWNDQVWFSLPYGDSEINNLVLVFDSKKQAFFPMDNNAASCYAYYNDGTGGGVRLYAGGPRKGWVNQQDVGTVDFNRPINAYWRGKFFDMGKPEVEKQTKDLYIQDSPKTKEIAEISVCKDYEADKDDLIYRKLYYYRSKGYTREFRFEPEHNRWRYLSPLLVHDGYEECEIRGIAIPYKPKTRLGVRN